MDGHLRRVVNTDCVDIFRNLDGWTPGRPECLNSGVMSGKGPCLGDLESIYVDFRGGLWYARMISKVRFLRIGMIRDAIIYIFSFEKVVSRVERA